MVSDVLMSPTPVCVAAVVSSLNVEVSMSAVVTVALVVRGTEEAVDWDVRRGVVGVVAGVDLVNVSSLPGVSSLRVEIRVACMVEL